MQLPGLSEGGIVFQEPLITQARPLINKGCDLQDRSFSVFLMDTDLKFLLRNKRKVSLQKKGLCVSAQALDTLGMQEPLPQPFLSAVLVTCHQSWSVNIK